MIFLLTNGTDYIGRLTRDIWFIVSQLYPIKMSALNNGFMSGTVKLVLVGLGLVGRRHADVVAKTKSAELVAIVDPSKDAQNYARKKSVKAYHSLEDMFTEQCPDGIILATPTLMHSEQAFYCIQRTCPVMIEKPIATSSQEALALVEKAESLDVPVLVGHHRRYNPIIQRANKVITSGEIGKVRAVHANCWFYKPDEYFEEAAWRKKRGAGPISVNLAHDIDLLRYFCGEIDFVQAQTAKSIRGFENEDVAGALLRFRNGAIGTISVSDSIVSPWSWEMTSKENPVYPPTSESCYFIGGSHGSLSIPDLTLWGQNSERDWWKPLEASAVDHEPADPLYNQIIHFIDVIKKEENPIVSGREGLFTLRVIEAIQKSALTQQSVKVES